MKIAVNIILILSSLLLSTEMYAKDHPVQEHEDIELLRSEIEGSLKSQLQASTGNQAVNVKVSNLDPRLKLAFCSQTKDIEVNQNRLKSANISARVSCRGDSPWNIYVPAKVEIMQSVVITTKDLYKGQIIGANDITLSKRDTGDLSFGYSQTPSQFIGSQTMRNISAGTVLNASQVDEPVAISRGDKIILESGVKGLSVSASVIAMSDGKIGEQIQVKNAQTKRIIEAYVVAPGRAVASL